MQLRSVALTLAGRWPVFPLVPGSKKPATRDGLDAATQSPDRISAWWERLPAANAGIPTGAGLVAVDLDPVDAEGSGYVSLSAYADSIGAGSAWLDTFTVTTPRRGIHLYFATEEPLGNRAAMLPGVDVRGERGYVVAPYSRLRSGDEVRSYLPESNYRETVGVCDDQAEVLEEFVPEIAPIPEWLADLIARPRPASEVRVFPESEIRNVDSYITAVLIGERHRMMLAEPGARNHAVNASAYRLGRHVAAGRLDYDEAEAWLIATAHQVIPEDRTDRGPLTVQEISGTVRSGLDSGVRHG